MQGSIFKFTQYYFKKQMQHNINLNVYGCISKGNTVLCELPNS